MTSAPTPFSKNDTEQTLDYLRHLSTRSKDAIEGYQHAASLVEGETLKEFFQANAEQRKKFALELEGHLRRMDAEPDSGASIVGKLHQTWMAVVSKFSSDERALLEECERGEEEAVNDYEKALSSFGLSPAVVGTVERQRDQIREELRNLKILRASLATK